MFRLFEQAKETERFIILSLVAHIVLLIVLFASDLIFPNKAALFIPSVQIDMVALPDLAKMAANPTVNPLLPVKNKEPPPPVPTAPEAHTKTKNPQAEAESAIQRLRQEVQKAKQDKAVKQQADLQKFQEQYRTMNRGNQVHQGTNMSGTMDATVNAYAAHVTDRLRSNWSLPVWLQSSGLRAVVRIHIDSHGSIIGFQFIQKSGNNVFDDCVKTAVQSSSPFAPPPSEMASGLRNGGLEVLFPL